MPLLLALAALLGVALPAGAADLVVLVDGPARPAVLAVADEFRRTTGHNVSFAFGPGPSLNKRVMNAERADVLIAPKRYLEELQSASKLSITDAKPIGNAGFSLAVRKGGARFDISTTDGLKSALLKADAVVFNNVGSGNYFASVIEKLSLSQAIAHKTVRLGPDLVFDRVATSSAAEIAVGTTPLLMADNRLEILGELPQEFQSSLELFAVPVAGASDRSAAEALVAYLAAPDTRERLAAAGLK